MSEIRSQIVSVVEAALAASLKTLPSNVSTGPVGIFRRIDNAGVFVREFRAASGRLFVVEPKQTPVELTKDEFVERLVAEDVPLDQLNSIPSTYIGLGA